MVGREGSRPIRVQNPSADPPGYNNHFHGYAPENCLQIMEMLGTTTSHGAAALRRVRLRGGE
jgi:hypothetical protein